MKAINSGVFLIQPTQLGRCLGSPQKGGREELRSFALQGGMAEAGARLSELLGGRERGEGECVLPVSIPEKAKIQSK